MPVVCVPLGTLPPTVNSTMKEVPSALGTRTRGLESAMPLARRSKSETLIMQGPLIYPSRAYFLGFPFNLVAWIGFVEAGSETLRPHLNAF